MKKLNKEDKEKLDDLFLQGMVALEVFLATGKRNQFVAWQDQAESLQRELDINFGEESEIL